MNNFVDIWHGPVLSEEEGDDLWLLLSEQEQLKAKQFLRPELQNKYISIRARLRKILSSYLNIDPQKLIINIAKHGKPFIKDCPLAFNLSHSKNHFVVAVSNCGEVGVDVEEDRKRADLSGLVDKCFAEPERKYWYSLSESQRISMFYHFWVRKEAFVKATGRGIALGLDQCVIDVDDLTAFITIPDDYGHASDWKIIDLSLAENSFAALVSQAVTYDFKQIVVK